MTADDKYDICETVYRFAHGVDTRDWALYRSIFADEVRVDYSSYGAFAPTVQSADAWVAGITPVWAHHVFEPADPASSFTLGGFYDDDLVRSSNGPVGWLITSVKLTVTWRTGDPKIMSIARRRGIEMQE